MEARFKLLPSDRVSPRESRDWKQAGKIEIESKGGEGKRRRADTASREAATTTRQRLDSALHHCHLVSCSGPHCPSLVLTS